MHVNSRPVCKLQNFESRSKVVWISKIFILEKKVYTIYGGFEFGFYELVNTVKASSLTYSHFSWEA